MHSGDLGVMHSDGYVELRDRAKDIIISGGENISTIEVEHALESHPAVLEAAVIGIPDEKWGERPKAFVIRSPDADVSEAELIAHVQKHIAQFKSPKAIEFVASLPRTAAGRSRSSNCVKRNGPGTSAGSRDKDMIDDRHLAEETATAVIGSPPAHRRTGLREQLTEAERKCGTGYGPGRRRGDSRRQRLLATRRVRVGVVPKLAELGIAGVRCRATAVRG